MTRVVQRSVRIARSAAEVFAWHERPGAFERLQPPWERVELLTPHGGIAVGTEVALRHRVGPWWIPWRVRHEEYAEGRQFRDVQVRGPFATWRHLHEFIPEGPGHCVLRDTIEYELPAPARALALGGAIRRRLERVFRYRHELTKADLEQPPAMHGTVLVSGASGLIGRALVPYLRTQGWDVLRLVRRSARAADEVRWAPERQELAWPRERRIDAVIHLAGAGVAEGRWTPTRKAEILRSRVEGTRTLVRAMLHADVRPQVIVSASGTGFYGDSGETEVDERAGPGSDFLATVCQAWEGELAAAEAANVRVVALRTGVVLSPAGGALAKMLPAFRLGLGGRLGHGRQWLSWISLDDWLDVCRAALTNPKLRGACNATAPAPVRQSEFATTLAKVLDRPALLAVPAPVLRLALGELADRALLTSTRAVPAALVQSGHRFRDPVLEVALRRLLGRWTSPPEHPAGVP
ncbi:MAG TPA: TIGR01777 family oxidoreductase [Candidatus Synoicihabitans sp.]|nr:TIGR01777 family oxidoreductase [Candidatus Synoicihabitans sp.]